jgi:hypothetical protein
MRPGQKLTQIGGTLQTRVESEGGKSPSLSGVLVRPDHSVSLRLEDLAKKSQLLLLQTNWPIHKDFLKVRPWLLLQIFNNYKMVNLKNIIYAKTPQKKKSLLKKYQVHLWLKYEPIVVFLRFYCILILNKL